MDALSDIAVFVEVVETGSFTAAADKLDVSKSVVSKYVTRLETRLGARLLHRTTRRLSLTEVGEAFYARSLKGLRELEEAEAEVALLQGAPRGTLKVNAPMSFGILHLSRLLPGFLACYPELQVDITFDDRQIDLVAEGYDLAIRIAELPDSSLVARRIGPCRHVVCASPEYLQGHGTPQCPADLRHHNAVIYKYRDAPAQWRFRAPNGEQLAVPVRGSIQANNSIAVRELVLAGAGITLTPTFVVGEDIQAGRLQRVLGDYQAQELSIYGVFPEREYLSPKVRVFVDYLAEEISPAPYWDMHF